MTSTTPPPDKPEVWEKPTIYSVLVIAVVMGLIGYAVYLDKLTLTDSLIAAILGVVTWVTRGARPPVANRIGTKRPPPGPQPPDEPPPPIVPLPRDLMPTPREPPASDPSPRVASCWACWMVPLGALTAMSVVACGQGAKVCAVVDLAHQTCTIVRYLETDGTERELRLSPEDARIFARSVAARRVASPDAGAP